MGVGSYGEMCFGHEPTCIQWSVLAVIAFLCFSLCLCAQCHLDKNTELGWGAFGHTIADPRNRFRLLEAGNAWRATFWQIPFGDQAMFVRTAALKRIGGFPIQEKYEDLELALRLKAKGIEKKYQIKVRSEGGIFL